MVLLPLAEIVARPLRLSVPGAGPFTQHLTLWVAFLGAALAASEERLLALATPTFLPAGPWRRGSKVFASTVAAGVTALLFRAALEFLLIERQAGRRNISLRTGCFCNPGAGEMALGLSRDELVGCFGQRPDGMTYEEFRTCIDDKGTGAVRVSLGIASNFADVEAFLRFAGPTPIDWRDRVHFYAVAARTMRRAPCSVPAVRDW